jgi:cyclophilin family peptidyl-prolyl cis-trans isomerase
MSTNVVKWVFIVLTAIIIVGGIVYMESGAKTPVPLGVGQTDTIAEKKNVASVSGVTKEEGTPVTPSPIQMASPIPTQSMKQKTYSTPPVITIDPKKTYSATMVTSAGTMKIRLNASEAPITVNNFVFLAREGFYANTIFHRILSGFMIQGGDPTGTGMGSPGYRFNDEPVTREYTRGTIAMANSGPNTNGSQFFIMHADYGLPKQYVIFGSIDPSDTESLKTLDALASTPVVESASGEPSKPVNPPSISAVTIIEEK